MQTNSNQGSFKTPFNLWLGILLKPKQTMPIAVEYATPANLIIHWILLAALAGFFSLLARFFNPSMMNPIDTFVSHFITEWNNVLITPILFFIYPSIRFTIGVLYISPIQYIGAKLLGSKAQKLFLGQTFLILIINGIQAVLGYFVFAITAPFVIIDTNIILLPMVSGIILYIYSLYLGYLYLRILHHLNKIQTLFLLILPLLIGMIIFFALAFAVLMSSNSPSLADTDNDGLTNLQEQEFGSNPLLSDSDNDGVSDIQEQANATNPSSPDSDNDGVSDLTEINAGLNPNSTDSDNDGIQDSAEQFLLKIPTGDPSIQITVSGRGDLARQIVADIDTTDVAILDNPEIILALNISALAETELDSAQIIFYYNEEDLNGIDENNLAIYYLDTNEMLLVPVADSGVNTNASKKYVWANINHFNKYVSKYVISTKTIYDKPWNGPN